MPGLSPSTILFEFLTGFVAAAAGGAVEQNAQVLDSREQTIDADKGIVVSNSEYLFGPVSVDDDEFYDALLIIGFFWRVSGDDWTERRATRDNCYRLALATARAIYADAELGGRVCDTKILQAVDGNDNSTGDAYEIINLPIILNPRSRRDYNLGEAR